MQRRGDHWYCGVCDPVRLPCAGCGNMRPGRLRGTGTGCPGAAGARTGTAATRWTRSPGRHRRRPGPAARDRRRGSRAAAVPGRHTSKSWPGRCEDRPRCSPGREPRRRPVGAAADRRALRRRAPPDHPPACPQLRPGRSRLHSRGRARALPDLRAPAPAPSPADGAAAVREPAARDGQGRPVCANCLISDPANLEVCVNCGRRRPVNTRSPDGPLCPALPAAAGPGLLGLRRAPALRDLPADRAAVVPALPGRLTPGARRCGQAGPIGSGTLRNRAAATALSRPSPTARPAMTARGRASAPLPPGAAAAGTADRPGRRHLPFARAR